MTSEPQPTNGSSSSNKAERTYVQPKHPLLTRLSYFVQLWSLKITSSTILSIIKYFKPAPPSHSPTLKKAYPCRPRLENRVFIPRSYTSGQNLPLLLSAHGGGCTLPSAKFDDEICAEFANKLNILVVSIEYRLALLFKFPVPLNDFVAIAQAVISDPNLPIDKERVINGKGALSFSSVQIMTGNPTPSVFMNGRRLYLIAGAFYSFKRKPEHAFIAFLARPGSSEG